MAVHEYRLIRCRRKTVGLIVERDASLTIRAPLGMPRAEIERVVRLKDSWITGKQKLARERAAVLEEKRSTEGEAHLYLGVFHPLTLEAGRPFLRFDGERFLLCPSQAHRGRELFVRWYREQTRRECTRRSELFAARMGLSYRSVRVSGAMQRWASCGATGNLNFSWRLVMAPPRVIDYVVVHELAHRAHPNHSAAFWNLVASVFPDWKEQRASLRRHGHRMVL
ncbi:MAG: M48 family metallopeptidase [Spirochaetota bacterium]